MPEDYVIQKMEALAILSDWTDMELFNEIMNSTPEHWALYINTLIVTTWDNFLHRVAWHEDKLLNHTESNTSDIQKQLNKAKNILKKLDHSKSSGQAQVQSHQTNAKPVGCHKNSPAPPYPEDNSMVLKSKTPKEKKS
jgi:hypothetical protein